MGIRAKLAPNWQLRPAGGQIGYQLSGALGGGLGAMGGLNQCRRATLRSCSTGGPGGLIAQAAKHRPKLAKIPEITKQYTIGVTGYYKTLNLGSFSHLGLGTSNRNVSTLVFVKTAAMLTKMHVPCMSHFGPPFGSFFLPSRGPFRVATLTTDINSRPLITMFA